MRRRRRQHRRRRRQHRQRRRRRQRRRPETSVFEASLSSRLFVARPTRRFRIERRLIWAQKKLSSSLSLNSLSRDVNCMRLFPREGPLEKKIASWGRALKTFFVP